MEGRASDKETTCVVCVSHSQDAVLLPCDHSVCPKCCDALRAAGEGEGQLDCPQCGKKDDSNPSPEPRANLSNPAQQRQPDQFAADSAPAAHLTPAGDPQEANKHDAPIEAATELTGRQCPEHKEALEFYCEDDGDCVCGPCTITGRHKSHTLMSLDKAQAEIKGKLISGVRVLQQTQQNCHFKHQDLEKSTAEIKTQIDQLKGNLSKKFSEWRKSLEEDEDDALKMIEEEGLRLLTQSTNCSEELNKRMNLIKLIDDETQSLDSKDPLSVIQYSKQLLSRAAEIQKQQNPGAHKDTLNIRSISEHIKKNIDKSMMYHTVILSMIGEWARLTLDPKTAYWFLTLSDDARSLTFGYDLQPYPSNPERFRTHRQILCCQSFSSGCHSWDVEADGIAWGIGIAYGSIEREGGSSDLTNSKKAWCLHFNHGTLTASHYTLHVNIIWDSAYNKFHVELDYESGCVSFYQIGDTQRHLYTFKTTFTEPVFPAFSCFYISSLKLC
ncbi:E3 ubiquitin-protein ligase TRIM7-like [Heptranchias perlo]|uniref:E3 ubiquitin-protein ligase TRIM7-like n=1 Tax=Heptranchias perlo TaxID=212740 RepID=UPI003559C693